MLEVFYLYHENRSNLQNVIKNDGYLVNKFAKSNFTGPSLNRQKKYATDIFGYFKNNFSYLHGEKNIGAEIIKRGFSQNLIYV